MNTIGILLAIIAFVELAKASSCPFVTTSYESELAFRESFLNETPEQSSELVPDPETTTPNGCTCASVCICGKHHCDLGILDTLGHNLTTRDWCQTAGECGQYSLTLGYWDFCLYLDSAIPEYSELSWKEKTNKIMKDVMRERSVGEGRYPYENTADFIYQSMVTTYENEWDWGPAGRNRLNHAVGAVCKFTLNITNSPYTGMLKNGIQTGLIRISIVQNAGDEYIPSAAVKFLRSGIKSANFVALPIFAKNSRMTNNIFEPDYYPLTNHILTSSGSRSQTTFGSFSNPKSLRNSQTTRKLLQGDECLHNVGLSDMTRYDQEGNEEEESIFPFRIILRPTGDVKFTEDWLPIDDFLQQFIDNISDGSPLYSFITYEDPEDEDGSELAQLIAVDGCFPSKYGDEHLFFQHQSGLEDAALRPDWESYYDCNYDCSMIDTCDDTPGHDD